MHELKLYKEKHGFLLGLLGGSKRCGHLKPNEDENLSMKHIPLVDIKGDTVNVSISTIKHPMELDHYIQMIILETKKGFQIRYLKPNDEPKATFKLFKDDEIIKVYEFCNLHGLWKNDDREYK